MLHNESCPCNKCITFQLNNFSLGPSYTQLHSSSPIIISTQYITPFLAGDGRPLTPLSHPVQTAETIHSITLGWGESLTPSHAPITHYTILLVELLEIEREIIFESFSNDTDAEVTGLSPGVMYRIYVYGVNDIGEGQRSNYVVGRTASSLVPLPPTRLNAEVVERGRVFDVILSWMVSCV